MILIIAQLLGVNPYNWNDNHDNVKILSMQDTEDIDTPAMIEYYKIKEANPGTVVLFRMGDFYEIFGEDAKILSKILNITLTSRDKNKKTPMAGFPYHALDSYIPKMMERGLRVAICEQIEETPENSKKRIIRREVVRIITPGTNLSISDDDIISNNYIYSIYPEGKNIFSSSFLDFVSGKFYILDLMDEKSLRSFMATLNPKEVLVPEDLSISIAFRQTPYNYFKKDFLYDYFNLSTLKGFGIDNNHLSLKPAGAIMHYINNTQRGTFDHIKTLTHFVSSDFMILDDTTLKSLEILENLKDKSYKGSLFETCNMTSTTMGARKLAFFLTHPLMDSSLIERRYEGVSELIELNVYEEISRILANMHDIERISARIGTTSINPRDMISLLQSIDVSRDLVKYLKNVKSEILIEILNILNVDNPSLNDLHNLISRNIVDSPPMNIKDGGFIKEGVNEQLDKYKKIIQDGKTWIISFQKEEQERLKIPSLKVHFNKVFGYYIEVSNTNIDKIPEDYIRKQTLKGVERYISLKLKEYEDMVINAESRALVLENNILQDIKIKIKDFISVIQLLSENISTLDVLTSFAKTSRYLNFRRPEINKDSKELEIINGRHPVVESFIAPNPYIPNDIILRKESDILIISGPNMSGKSSILRQTALIVILAQSGSFVPAEKAIVPIVDRIFTRVGASDNLSGGESTFMVEMIESANILNNATENSLIILDEVGRGTSTYDGVAIAWAIIEYIHDNLGSKTLFATHYNELLVLEEILPRVFNMHVKVIEKNKKVIFLRVLEKGGTDKSYGVHVASIAGLPSSVIQRAYELLSDFEKNKSKYKKKLYEQSIFTVPREESLIEEELKEIDMNTLSPIDAFNKLLEIKKKIK
ncbi:MAG: DNA mismatch repair protein MutS [Patescibacteria group bacterium]